MNFNELIYFDAIVRAGSFKSASKSVYISQQALSAAIKKMETEIGVDLFLRLNNGIVLTEAGKELHTVAQLVIQCLDQIAEVGVQQGKYPINILYLSHFIFHEILLYKIQNKFNEQYPDIQVSMTQAMNLEDVPLQNYTFICCHSSSCLGKGRSWKQVLRVFDKIVFARDRYCFIVNKSARSQKGAFPVQLLLTLNREELPKGFLNHVETLGYRIQGPTEDKKTLENILTLVSLDPTCGACISHIALQRYQGSLEQLSVMEFPLLPMSEHLLLAHRARLKANPCAQRFLQMLQEQCRCELAHDRMRGNS